MYPRNRAREVALQLLFERDFLPQPLPAKELESFAQARLRAVPEQVAYCLYLYNGVEQHRGEIDRVLHAVLENWRLSRLHPVDRNVLRLATFQILFDSDPQPVPVIIHEAANLANRYGTEESARFVMGILDKLGQQRSASSTALSEPSNPGHEQGDAKGNTREVSDV
jgi:N utilization substance protein B